MADLTTLSDEELQKLRDMYRNTDKFKDFAKRQFPSEIDENTLLDLYIFEHHQDNPEKQSDDIIHDDPVQTEQEFRVRSDDNFDNTLEMYKLELEIFKDREYISEEEFNKALKILNSMNQVRDTAGLSNQDEIQKSESLVSPEEAAEAVQLVLDNREKVKNADEYKKDIIEKLVQRIEAGDERAEALFTPELVSFAIVSYNRQAKKGKEEEKDKARQLAQNMFTRGNSLLSDLQKKEGYYFTDITNAADEYDGYMHLADVCDEYAKQHKVENAPDYKAIKALMDDDYIRPYDTLFHIPDGKNSHTTAVRINGRLDKASKVLEALEFNEDNLGKDFLETIDNFKFIKNYDDNKQPIYENCLEKDDNGKLRVIKGSSLDTALRFSANQTVLENLADFKQEISPELLLEGAKANAFQTLFAYSNSEEAIKKGLKENPERFTDKKYAEEFRKNLEQGEKTEISPLALEAALKRQAHNVEVYGNRLSSKLGKDKTAYIKAALTRQVAQIDKTSPYKDNTDFIKKKATKRNLWGVGFGGAIAFTTSYLMTKMSAGSAMTASLANMQNAGASLSMGAELAAGGGHACIGALIGAGAASIGYFASKKITAMVKRQKYGWKDVKKDLKNPAFYAVVTAGALGGASVGFAISGCPKCAFACGMGSLAAASTARFITPYRDMRLAGHGKAAAFGMGALNAVVVGCSGYFGHQVGLPKEGLDGQIAANETQTKEMYASQEQAAADGWKMETSTTAQDGYYLVDQQSEGPYHSYTPEESAWAQMRNDGVRWSEFLNGGKGGLHVLDEYQNGLTGLQHDEAMRQNAIRVLDEAAKQNSWMNSLQDGEPVSNSEMLLYKVYQEAALHPNENALTADGSMTVGDYFKADDNHTMHSLFSKLLAGKSLDKADLSVLSKIEDHVGGQISENVNDMGKVIDVHGATHPENTPVDSYNSNADKGYDVQNLTSSLFAKFTKTFHIDPTSGFGALVLGGVNKVKDFFRPGAKADIIKKEKTQVVDPIPVPGPTPPIPEPTPPMPEPIPEPTPPTPEPIPEEVKKLLMDEYQIVHGIKPGDKEYNRYLGLVQAEWAADKDSGVSKEKDFQAYLYKRQKDMEDKIFSPENVDAAGKVSLVAERKELLSERADSLTPKERIAEKNVRTDAINNTRNVIWQGHKNLDAVKDKEVKNLTLKDFMKVMPNVFKKNNQGNKNTIDPKMAPAARGRKGRE